MTINCSNTNLNELNLLLVQGNNAIKIGNFSQSFEYYKKGLLKARELKNKEKTEEFAQRLMLLL